MNEKEPQSLRRSDVDPNPIVEFGRWFERAGSSDLQEPSAASLATADASGRPSCRMVLLKSFDDRGFVFYTNSESRKGKDLEVNPHAALTFWWDRLHRQVRIEGGMTEVSAVQSDEYFASRPISSKLGAWASDQSREIATRAALEDRLREVETRFTDGRVPRPPHWYGYRIAPEAIEFWQGQRSRLHDRIRYQRAGECWVIKRLSP